MMVHFPFKFLTEWREFPPAHCLAGKKLNDISLDVVEMSRVAFQPL